MKNLICIIAFLMNSLFLIGQNSHYTVSREIKLDNSTYICNVGPTNWVTLYNKDYKFDPECEQVYTSTNKKVPQHHEAWFVPDGIMYKRCKSIWINSVLPYVAREKADGAMVEIYVDPETGRVADVMFSFTSFADVAKIPPAVYRKIEVDIKEMLHFNITTAGKEVNYIYFMYIYKVK